MAINKHVRVNMSRKTDELLTEHDVSEIIGVSVYALRAWRNNSKGPKWFRLGLRLVRYSRNDLDIWLSELREAKGAN